MTTGERRSASCSRGAKRKERVVDLRRARLRARNDRRDGGLGGKPRDRVAPDGDESWNSGPSRDRGPPTESITALIRSLGLHAEHINRDDILHALLVCAGCTNWNSSAPETAASSWTQQASVLPLWRQEGRLQEGTTAQGYTTRQWIADHTPPRALDLVRHECVFWSM